MSDNLDDLYNGNAEEQPENLPPEEQPEADDQVEQIADAVAADGDQGNNQEADAANAQRMERVVRVDFAVGDNPEGYELPFPRPPLWNEHGVRDDPDALAEFAYWDARLARGDPRVFDDFLIENDMAVFLYLLRIELNIE